MRVGIGYDVHQLVKERRLIIGGVQIPYAKGLLGHSDADVLVHAIMDALLGALALGSIGDHFPDTDNKHKDANSLELMAKVVSLIKAKGYKIVNIDSMIICQAPKLAGYIGQMRENIAKISGLKPEDVSVKATTTEKLGFVGRKEGIAAEAVALLQAIK